ncbi:MAG: molybdenum cofactor guanylyltransferase, partial [Acidimicrobiaceae bacterium]|nr:molybdenum cofactor guanylyltransferase [Acidimicrobiaceae bacterium]
MPAAALLLTGGLSRRMGTPKAQLIVGGEDLASRGARLLLAVADPVYEVGPGFSDLPVITEDRAGFGPLAALGEVARAAVLPASRSVLVLAVDMPFVGIELLGLLVDHPAPASAAVVPVDRSGRDQPLCARWPAAALAAAAALVDQGELSMRALLDAV